jgi:hypothetical protein
MMSRHLPVCTRTTQFKTLNARRTRIAESARLASNIHGSGKPDSHAEFRNMTSPVVSVSGKQKLCEE